MVSKIDILQALRARLLLERGLGAEYISGNSDDAEWSGRLQEGLLAADKSPVVEMPKPRPEPHPVIDARPEPEEHAPLPSSREQDSSPPKRATPGVVPVSAGIPLNPEKTAALAESYAAAMSCEACGLCAKRNSVVWGEGSLDAKVMFIGEGPGRDEDLEGRPFVGRSGRVLTDIIEKGMKTPRGQVYIANVVKCRPPGNRDPKPEEVAACARYLEKQIEVINPHVIVAVGGVAGCALLRLPPKTPGLRKRWHEYRGVPLRVIFHPSYLLRQRRNEGDRTDADRDTWKDIVEVLKRLDDA